MTEAPGTHNPQFLPSDIPAPQDDGGARHLTGAKLPDIALPTTDEMFAFGCRLANICSGSLAPGE